MAFPCYPVLNGRSGTSPSSTSPTLRRREHLGGDGHSIAKALDALHILGGTAQVQHGFEKVVQDNLKQREKEL